MSFLVVMGVIFAALFLLVFVLKRRLGILGLALAAGSILATLWVGSLTPVVAEAGIIVIRPPLSSLVSVFLLFLPVFLLFFSGASTKGTLLRGVSALLFAMLALAFMLDSLDSALVIDATSRPIYEAMREYKPIIITVGLVLSVVDLILGKKLGREHAARH